MNIIVRDKKDFDVESAREKINAWLAVDYGAAPLFEPHYNDIPKKIIAEKFMTDGKNVDLVDYKFLCFNGTPRYCQVMNDRSSELTIDYFDMDWSFTDLERVGHPNSKNAANTSKPKNFELMKELAENLSKDFIFVRVDFYEIEGNVYLGEMTFTPGGGINLCTKKEYDERMGSLMTLPI